VADNRASDGQNQKEGPNELSSAMYFFMNQPPRFPTENCRAVGSTLLVQLRGTEMPGRLHAALRSTRRLLSRSRDIGFHHPTSSGTPSSESARRNCSACSYE
jgi:hypothetical protein